MSNLNEQIIALLRPVIESADIAKFHTPESYGYRSIGLDASFMSDGAKLEWRIYAGGDFAGNNIYGESVDEVIEKIRRFEPEEAKRREIAQCEKRLAQLKGQTT